MPKRFQYRARLTWLATAVVVLTVGLGTAPAAENVFTFTLRGGGRVDGEWLNPKQRPFKTYQVQLAGGALVEFSKQQVAEARRRSIDAIQYEQIAPDYADTISAQWELAEWCRNRRLLDQRKAHLQRIIQLDPDHLRARRGLGYIQVGNQWLTQPQLRESQGFVYYRGRWRMPQEAKLLEARKQKERAEREWMSRLKQLHKDLQSRRAADARKKILEIRDPHAVRGLSASLAERRPRALKLLHVRVLAKIGDSEAATALINTSLNDPDPEVFHAIVDEIVDMKSPLATRAYVVGLKDSNNVRVNRAAYVLGQLGDPKAIGPLISALVTTHRVVQNVTAGGTQGIPLAATFARPGNNPNPDACSDSSPISGTNFSTGSHPRVVATAVPNQEVLHALANLTNGVSFGFDKKAWDNWLAAQRQSDLPGSLSER